MFQRVLCVILLISISVLLIDGAKKKKSCANVLSKIPVHKKFNLDRFLGTWYVVTRTTRAWGDKTFESASIEFYKNSDGTYSFSFTGKQKGSTCAPVNTGAVEMTGRAGQYLLKMGGDDTDHSTMIISFTDYSKTAMVYHCFTYKSDKKDQCSVAGSQVEILSRSENPKDKDIKGYVKRANKRLCATSNDLVDTKPGQCKVPDILEAAKREELLKQEKEKKKDSNKCAVSNVPVQADFHPSQMTGLWYEIARTRKTFNKMESVVANHRYDNVTNTIDSYYTGTVTSDDDQEAECMTAIHGMSKKREGAELEGDMVGRIGDEDSGYTWSPMKVMYADDQYLIIYACYAEIADGDECPDNAAEVAIVGRTLEMNDAVREILFSNLEHTCFEPSQIVDTRFDVNCTSWVTVEPEPEALGPEDCPLDQIPIFMDYDKEEVIGLWRLYGYISTAENFTLTGSTMYKFKGRSLETIQTKVSARRNVLNATCSVYDISSRERCLGSADHVSTLPIDNEGNFVFTKILHQSNSLLVEYTCTKMTFEGTCDQDGVMFYVYIRNLTVELSDEDFSLLHKLAVSVCIEPTMFVLENDWCELEIEVPDTDYEDYSECDIDNIEIFSDLEDFVQEDIYGYWYEVVRSNDHDTLVDFISTVAYITSDSNKTLQIYYTGLEPDEAEPENRSCASVEVIKAFSRCSNDDAGDYLLQYNEEDHVSTFVPFKIMYTDYINVLVTYVCQNVMDNGQCHPNYGHIRVWSRNVTLDEDLQEYAIDLLYWACVDPYLPGYLRYTLHRDEESCMVELEDYVNENDLVNIQEVEVDIENSEFDPTQQMDEKNKDDDFSDIDAAMEIPDDVFYGEYDDNDEDNEDNDNDEDNDNNEDNGDEDKEEDNDEN